MYRVGVINSKKMRYEKALKIAENLKDQLKDHCFKIEIAGSIRRRRATVNDIELVLVPKQFEMCLFSSGIASVIQDYKIIKGKDLKKYVRIEIEEGIQADLFFCEISTWGYIYMIRTGSVEFSKKIASRWVSKGYKGIDGWLTHASTGKKIAIPEEIDLFKRLGLDYVKPWKRK